MKLNSRLTSFCAVPLLAAVSMLCAVQPASADFLYDVSIPDSFYLGFTADIKFTQPAIVTSPTTVTSFLLNQSSIFGPVTSVFLNPVPGGICQTGSFNFDYSPCLTLNFAPEAISVGDFAAPSFTSVGTFTAENGGVILTISSFVTPAPEPSSLGLLLFVTMLGGAGFAFQKRLRGRKMAGSPVPAS
jgi:hypothetical protein